jgi:hypothetical protein
MSDYNNKYLKYKYKYILLKNQHKIHIEGGGNIRNKLRVFKNKSSLMKVLKTPIQMITNFLRILHITKFTFIDLKEKIISILINNNSVKAKLIVDQGVNAQVTAKLNEALGTSFSDVYKAMQDSRFQTTLGVISDDPQQNSQQGGTLTRPAILAGLTFGTLYGTVFGSSMPAVGAAVGAVAGPAVGAVAGPAVGAAAATAVGAFAAAAAPAVAAAALGVIICVCIVKYMDKEVERTVKFLVAIELPGMKTTK